MAKKSEKKSDRKERKQPLMIQYTNLLHANGKNPKAPAVKKFFDKHTDPVFRRRAKVLHNLCKVSTLHG
jgi:hypothetical protein